MKINNLNGSNIAFVIGALFIALSTVNTNGNNGATFAMGNIILFGSIAYTARRKQHVVPSKQWLIAEIISIIIVLYFTLLGVISGGWYQHPISFLVAPLWVIVAYCIALFKDKHVSMTHKSGSTDYTNLEKLAELRDKGIITEEEFKAKKKKVLQI